METDYIPELIALAEYGSSYVAAEKLFISQSSLLRHVQSIEEELGMPLFERSRKGFVLNEAGERFLPYARQIYALKERCCSVLHQEDSGKRGCLTKQEVRQSFFYGKEHTKNTRNHKGIGRLQYNVGDETNTKPAVRL